MKTAFINIKELVQIRNENEKNVAGKDMQKLPTLSNAFLVIEKDKIVDFGTMNHFDYTLNAKIFDVSGKMIFPSWCDSHTHIVFAGNRENEFLEKIKGLTYEEIASKGGGILNSAIKLQQTDEDELFKAAEKRLQEIISLGTGAVEIKSGYGLSTESELKMLRVIKRLKEKFDISIKATFLGAHAFPKQYQENKEAYIDIIINEMLPAIKKEQLAEYVDVFCENGYFNTKQTDRILIAAKKFGFIPKVHVNQFNSIGGIEICVKNNALSVDHLEVMTEDDFSQLKKSETIPVALPGCSFFINIPYTPGRKIIDEGLPLALASDFNPGSCPTGNMNFIVSLACIKMKLTPEEAINAATLNGAYALGLSHEVGSITIGKKANFFITKEIPSYGFLPYSFGSNLIDSIYLNGKMQ